MTLYEFIALDEMEQGKAVLKAPQIAERNDGDYNILLYQIDRFYVEAYINVELGTLRFRPFQSDTPLAPYLNLIEISRP